MSHGLPIYSCVHSRKYCCFRADLKGENGSPQVLVSVKPHPAFSLPGNHLGVCSRGLRAPVVCTVLSGARQPVDTFACMLVIHTSPVEPLHAVLPATCAVSGQGTDLLIVWFVCLFVFILTWCKNTSNKPPAELLKKAPCASQALAHRPLTAYTPVPCCPLNMACLLLCVQNGALPLRPVR